MYGVWILLYRETPFKINNFFILCKANVMVKKLMVSPLASRTLLWEKSLSVFFSGGSNFFSAFKALHCG